MDDICNHNSTDMLIHATSVFRVDRIDPIAFARMTRMAVGFQLISSSRVDGPMGVGHRIFRTTTPSSLCRTQALGRQDTKIRIILSLTMLFQIWK